MNEKTLKVKYEESSFSTIPGPSASLTIEGETIEDTILGQSWSSNWVGLLNWSVSTTAYWKGVAGYQAQIGHGGDSLCGRSFTLTQSADVVNKSSLCAVQANGGYMVQAPGLRTVELSVSGFYEDLGMLDTLEDRSVATITIKPAGATGDTTVAEGDFIFLSDNMSGDVGAVEEEELSFGLYVAVDDLTPFMWTIDETETEEGVDVPMPTAVVHLINSFMDRGNVKIQYDPGTGDTFTGEAFVSDLSLTAGTEGNIEFSVELTSASELSMLSTS
jgi:hypothetical protein